MGKYSRFLAQARVEQILTEANILTEVAPDDFAGGIAEALVMHAVDTSFQPRRRQVTLTFDLDDDTEDEPT